MTEEDRVSDEQLCADLRERYSPTPIPPCRVCGGELSIQRIGGGEPTIWACQGFDIVDGKYVFKPGRKIADDHYGHSEFRDYSRGGDSDVLELIARFQLHKESK